MFEDVFLRKKAVPEKLESYGFQKTRNSYWYSTNILDGAFDLEITIGKGIVPDTKLIELATGEEYVLYKNGCRRNICRRSSNSGWRYSAGDCRPVL